MSNKGIFTALSGSMAQIERIDTIANNISNVNTPGFKRDAQVFKEYLTANEKVPDVIQVPRVPASIESFHDMQSADRGYVDSAGTYTDFSQGGMKSTGNSLDIAIEGKGFMEILTPQGVQYTRNGGLSIDGEGVLVTKSGYPVLKSEDSAGNPEDRMIRLKGSNISVGSKGNIYQKDNLIGKLAIVEFGNIDALKKMGSGLYSLKDNQNPEVSDAKNYQIHQGILESSNVNVIREMTDMITATRAFESTQKAIKAYDEMNGKLVNEVPKT